MTDPADSGSGGHARDDDAASRGCILMIDDEASLLSLAGKLLRTLGYEALLAEDGKRGLAVFDEQSARIDAVILDMSMPGLSGDEVFERLRDRRADVPVLLSTGHAPDEYIEELLRRERVFLLQKPYGRDQLAEALDRALGLA